MIDFCNLEKYRENNRIDTGTSLFTILLISSSGL